MNENKMRIYTALQVTPQEARKTIRGGRLNGFTDINPMWRIKKLTELFGPCGLGWKVEVVKSELVPSETGEVKAFVHINLYVSEGSVWSDPIPGFGGSSFVSKEKTGLFVSDECFKMAFTDAIGSACKMLGMSADIFFEKDRTKYTSLDEPQPMEPQPPEPRQITVQEAAATVMDFGEYTGKTLGELYKQNLIYIVTLYNDPTTPADIRQKIDILKAAMAKAARGGKNA